MNPSDTDAFDRFYRSFSRKVFYVFRSQGLPTEDTYDQVQEVFLRAYRHFSTLSRLPEGRQWAWLLTTARHLAIDWRRKKASERRMRLEAEMDHAASAVIGGVEVGGGLQDELHRALEGLPDVQRVVVVMRFLEGMNSREIGEVLGIPDGTVRYHLHQARERLAKILKGSSRP